jgi:hypothetical protein
MFVAVVTITGSAVAADTAGALGVAIAMACGIALQNVLTFTVTRVRLGIWVYPDLSPRGLRRLAGDIRASTRSRSR